MSVSAPPLVLIGPMAAGKTRTGKRLARRLELEFTDTDREVEAQHGPIPQIFAELGESAFRELERAAVQQAIARGGVIAFGGGAVLHPDTQNDLADCAVVYLSTTADAVAPRLDRGGRPLVADGGLERWSEIYEARRAIYERLGKIHLDTSRRPMESVVDELLAWYRSRYATDSGGNAE